MPLGPFKISPGLCNLTLEEVTGISGGFVAALQVRADEPVCDPVHHLGNQGGGFRNIDDPDQLAFLGCDDLQSLGDLRRRGLAPSGRIQCWIDELRVRREVEILRNALSKTSAGKQAHLR